MTDIGRPLKEIEFEPFPEAPPLEEPAPTQPVVVPEPEKVPA